jgi:hypothetical protein
MRIYVICISLANFFFIILVAEPLNSLGHALTSLSPAKIPERQFSAKELQLLYKNFQLFFDEMYQAGEYQTNYKTHKSFVGQNLLKTTRLFVEVMKEKLKTAEWISGGTPSYFFVRKLVLPANSVIEFRGDLHGDIRSLLRWLDSLHENGWFDKNNPFKLIKKDCYLAFLGDYVDRGHYGAEIMFIIMQLFLHNPDHILIVRGNHEDRGIALQYGFYNELKEKFSFDSAQFKTVTQVYEYLPVALFLGCKNNAEGVDFIQCCHGGMEPWYNWKPLLDNKKNDLYEWLDKRIDEDRTNIPCVLKIDSQDLLEKCVCNQYYPCVMNGFQWNDFDFFNEKPGELWNFRDGRGYVVHQNLATQLLQRDKNSKNRVWAVFRAHQHDTKTVTHILEYGHGLYKLWSSKTLEPKKWSGEQNYQWVEYDTSKVGDGIPIETYSVWTFNVAPRTGTYEKRIESKFIYDTVARLELKAGFEGWKLMPRQIPVK